MVRRKGELTTGAIDRGWPYQVALVTPLGRRHDAITAFCRDLSVCQRTTGSYRQDHWYVCYCFSLRADAEKFAAQFGGDLVHPKDRPKWPGNR